jgi:hypothetical protein
LNTPAHTILEKSSLPIETSEYTGFSQICVCWGQLSKLLIPGVVAGLAAPGSIQKNSAFMLVLLTEFLVLLHAYWMLQVIEVNRVQQTREIMRKILSCSSTLLHVSCLHVHSYSVVSAVLQSFRTKRLEHYAFPGK